MIAPTPPFPVMVVAYGMAGFGMSFQVSALSSMSNLRFIMYTRKKMAD